MATSGSKSGEKSQPPATTPAVQFKFVTDSTQERSLIRRHAMQGVWRQRRQQTQQNSNRPASERTRKLTPAKQREKENDKSKEKSTSVHRASVARRNVDNAKQMMSSDSEIETLQILTTRPDSMMMVRSGSLDIIASPTSSVSSATYVCSPSALGGSELDPFESLPIRIHQEEQELLHVCEYSLRCKYSYSILELTTWLKRARDA